MARLSEEHFRATASKSTPKSARTSGRLRDIFKTRGSDSSTSPKTLKKSPLPTFETGSFLPSDHESLHSVINQGTQGVGELNSPTSSEGSVSGEAAATVGGFGVVQAADTSMKTEPGTDIEAASNAKAGSAGALFASTPVQGKFPIFAFSVWYLQADTCR